MFEKEEGTLQKTQGKVQEAAGGLLGDAQWQFKGKARQVAGQMQQTYGDTLDTLRDATSSTPIAALAIVGSLGFLIGALWARS